MHIVLFGGAFDPPHLGHQKIAEELLSQNICDEVWYLPVKNHHFEKKMNALSHRIAMLEIILKDISKTRIELYETQQEGVNYTYLTMKALSSQYPEHNFSFVIGSDNLAGFDRWLERHPKTLDFPFFVYPRSGFPFEPMYPNMTPLTGFEEVTVSSTDIREKVQNGESVTGLVDKRVEEYIIREGLYKT